MSGNAAVATRPLEYLPIALFGSVMGLTALSVAWRLGHARFGVPVWISSWIGATAVIAFVLITCGYAVKIVNAPDVVRAEFAHPIGGNLFGTFLISLLLLPLVVAPASLLLAQCLWVAGAVGMLAFAWLMVDRWLSDRQQVAHATPAWFVPVVGMLDVPLALPSLGLPPMHGVMVMGLAVGLFFAIPLFTLVFSRLLFEPPMPDSLQPTLMILLAPFAVGTSAYIATTGQVDLFAQSLFALTVFMLMALGGRLRYLARCCPFRIAWWAVSFPLAAAAIAALRIAETSPGWLTDGVAALLLGAATLIILGLLGRTVLGIARGELRDLSG
jgi:tellurite resistance protein